MEAEKFKKKSKSDKKKLRLLNDSSVGLKEEEESGTRMLEDNYWILIKMHLFQQLAKPT